MVTEGRDAGVAATSSTVLVMEHTNLMHCLITAQHDGVKLSLLVASSREQPLEGARLKGQR